MVPCVVGRREEVERYALGVLFFIPRKCTFFLVRRRHTFAIVCCGGRLVPSIDENCVSLQSIQHRIPVCVVCDILWRYMCRFMSAVFYNMCLFISLFTGNVRWGKRKFYGLVVSLHVSQIKSIVEIAIHSACNFLVFKIVRKDLHR